MNNQEIFDRVAVHLLTQKKRAQEECLGIPAIPTDCRYRTEDGLKCAVGCLIPDELYQPSMEGRGIDNAHPAVWAALRTVGITRRNINILARLQNLHDVCAVGAWCADLEVLARKFRIKPTVLAQFKNSIDTKPAPAAHSNPRS